MKCRFLLILFFVPLSVFPLRIKCFPKKFVLIEGGAVIKPQEGNDGVMYLDNGVREGYGFLRADGYRDKYIFLSRGDSSVREYKLERLNTDLVFSGFLPTGSQPKSVRFSPDGRYVVAALLDGGGIDVYDMKNLRVRKKIRLPSGYSGRKGFVESLFLKRAGELWISQMTTGMIHVFDSTTFAYLMSFSVKGAWPKVLTAGKDERRVFVSNWESRTVSVIDTASHTVSDTYRIPGIPRGMGVSPDGRYLYVAVYSGGKVVKIDTDKGGIVKKINLGDGAPRHIVVAENSGRIYVSDMYYGNVAVIDSGSDRVVNIFHVGSNLNTIALSRDERYLFISSRGKNSRYGYLHKGPVFGKIFVYDTVLKRIVDWTWGGNQPTGLDVSPDGRTVVFSDFLDSRLEIYNWER